MVLGNVYHYHMNVVILSGFQSVLYGVLLPPSRICFSGVYYNNEYLQPLYFELSFDKWHKIYKIELPLYKRRANKIHLRP